MNTEKQYYCWYITFWLCGEKGQWGFHHCVYRQELPLLNIKGVTERFQYAYNIANNTDYHFVLMNYQSITYEEFCCNGEIAFAEPDKKANDMAQDIINDNQQMK